MTQTMLTTIDNPFDPFEQWDEWLACDEALAIINNRPTTNSWLDRICKSSDELSDEDQEQAIEQAIDEIVRENVFGVYKKATRG